MVWSLHQNSPAPAPRQRGRGKPLTCFLTPSSAVVVGGVSVVRVRAEILMGYPATPGANEDQHSNDRPRPHTEDHLHHNPQQQPWPGSSRVPVNPGPARPAAAEPQRQASGEDPEIMDIAEGPGESERPRQGLAGGASPLQESGGEAGEGQREGQAHRGAAAGSWAEAGEDGAGRGVGGGGAEAVEGLEQEKARLENALRHLERSNRELQVRLCYS